ncbi:MAG: pilus assembly protein [Comamonas sp.]
MTMTATQAMRRAALLAAVLLQTACSSPPQGYGVSTRATPAATSMVPDAASSTSPAERTRETYLGLIRQMQTQGLWFASLAHIDAYEIQYGASPEVSLLRADALRNAGQVDEAIAIYKTMVNGPQAAQALRGLGLAAGARQAFAQAAGYFQQAQRRSPTDASILSDLAYAQMRAGQIRQAWIPIMQAAQLAPSDGRVQSNLALFYYVQGDETRAEQVLAAMPQANASTRDTLRTMAASIRAQAGGSESISSNTKLQE